MRRILGRTSLLAALFALAAPVRATPAEPVATKALLALAPDRAAIALATQSTPTASIYTISATATGNGTISPSGDQKVLPTKDQTFTMTPLTCAQVDNVRVDGVDLGPLTTYTFRNVNANHTIEAIFVSAPPDTIVASAGAGGTISPAGAVTYDCGASPTYTITAGDCRLIGDVRVDGASQGAVPSYTFSSLRASHTIAVSFVLGPNSTITATAGANGTMTPAGAVAVNCGADQTFTFSPNSCYRIGDVMVDGVSQGPVASYTFANVRTPHSITASFAYAAIQHTITASAGPGGSIDPSGAVLVGCGTNQTFTIRHDACQQILDVNVDGDSKGPLSSFTFTDVKASHTIAASFYSTPQYPITASAGPGGVIVPSGIVQVDCGASQTFTFISDDTLSTTVVVVDGIPQPSTTSYTFTNVTDPHSISIGFSTNYQIFVGARMCSGAGQYKPTVRGGPLHPNTSYWFDVQPLDCDPPEAGAHLERVGSVQTNEFGNIFTSDAPCFSQFRQTVILDVRGNGVFDPVFDPTGCFDVSTSTPTEGIQSLEAEITPEGALLSWWLMDVTSYRGFVVHRAPEGGEEVVVTPTPLAPPSSHPPAEMRWRDDSAAPGSRYAYRIEALKSAGTGSDWYGPVTLSIPAAPTRLALRGATPNPFSGTTHLAMDMPANEGELRMDVFDVAGRHVRTLRPRAMSPGQDVVDWDGLDDHGAPARGGLYMVRVQGARGASVMRVMKLD
jgi:hypothetical protein